MSAAMKTYWEKPGPWLGLATGTGAPILAWAIFGVISWPLALALLVIPAVFLVQLVRTIRGGGTFDFGSSAMKRYNFRMAAASIVYVVGLMVAIRLHESAGPDADLSLIALIAMLPTAPALAMVFVIGRYLVEETDEYLRHRASISAIIGLGVVLALGTIWGFLETFGLVPNIFAWWVVPVWAVGLAIGQGILKIRDDKQGEAQ